MAVADMVAEKEEVGVVMGAVGVAKAMAVKPSSK